MDWGALVFALAFALFGLVCLASVLPGLPGTWVLLAVAASAELLDGWVTGSSAAVTFGWGRLALATGLALAGEAVEAAAGAAGTRLYGGTRRGMVGAFVGGIAGAILLTGLLPVPVLGTLVGALLGTFLGALAGELTTPERRGRDATLRAAVGAVLGRLGGTLGKLAAGAAAWIVLVAAAWPD